MKGHANGHTAVVNGHASTPATNGGHADAKPGPPPPRKKVLFLTNSEHGQANVLLAAAHAMLEQDPSVEVHFGSFEPIHKTVDAASQYALETCGHKDARPIVFHEVQGITFIGCMMKPEFPAWDWLTLAPGFWNTPRLLQIMVEGMFHPWTPPEYVVVLRSCLEILQKVRPDLVVLDNAFSPGVTAAYHLGFRFLLLAPNTIKDFAAGVQPWGQAFWKFPCVLSALPYPIPWSQVPLNIFYTFVLMYHALLDEKKTALDKYVKRETGATIIRMDKFMYAPPPYLKILVATRAEFDFPVHIPRHIVPCGTIIRPAPSVADVDPDLERWLARGPTVYITLGTHKMLDKRLAIEMATAVRMLLDKGAEMGGQWARLQVLWKMRRRGEFMKQFDYSVDKGSDFYDILAREMEEDRIKIVKWVTAEPIAVLETGNVCCLVSHGGANSFGDGITAGVPQVVLPTWVDCYEFGSRAEMLGIGLWGNKEARPRWAARELGLALVETILGPKADAMRRRAKELQELTLQDGGGRNVAAKIILNEVA